MRSLLTFIQRLIQTRQSPRQTESGSCQDQHIEHSPQPSCSAPSELQAKQPVLVRGRLWKDTAEDGWVLRSENDAQAGCVVDDLIKGLASSNRAEIRRTSVESLGKLGHPARPAIPFLIRASIDMDASVRSASLRALEEIDPAWSQKAEAQKAIPGLVSSLNSWSAEVSRAAYDTLLLIGLPIVDQLNQALLNGEDTIDKVYMARLLAKLGPDAYDAVPGLSQALKSRFLQMRIAAAETLSNFGSRAEMAILPLIANLTDSFADGRRAMAACLCQIGPAAEPAIPALVPLLADRKSEVREAAALALKSIGTRAVPAMIEIVQTRDLARMRMWLESMSRMYHLSHASPTIISVDLYHQALSNISWTAYDIMEEQEGLEAAQEYALHILGELGPVSDIVVPTIARVLDDPNPRLRRAAVEALGQIGVPANEIRSMLTWASRDASPMVRDGAAKALSELDAKIAAENEQASVQ